MYSDGKVQVTLKQLLAFFIPLGISASLVTISHVIINSTLARSAHPEIIIASYALPMSLLGITERPAILLRQTCSALVRDRISFTAMSRLTVYVLSSVLVAGLIVAYTPLGRAIFQHLLGVQPELLDPVMSVYRVLMFVSIFSGLRCVFHGIIISNLRTKWLTIGMIVRLAAMYLLSLYFISTDSVTSGMVGAIIFLVGMAIESAVSFIEGRSLLKHTIPRKKADHPVETVGHIFRFYKPLLFSSFIAVVIGPSINAALGKSDNVQLAIASFAIASSLTQLVQSFFSYIHQIVLNFYRKDSRQVHRFLMVVAFIPTLLIAILAYTPLGTWFMANVMGVNERLMVASIETLRIFMLTTLIFPWLDFGNGIIMLQGETKLMVWSQAANVTVTLISLVACIFINSGWNGAIGALAQSLGLAAEAGVVLYMLRVTLHSDRTLKSAV
ncbi:multi antimicrobial extrusion protein MatE [Paenibacillus thalictri]|uniref:Multi antimicrobial extrusion protein MatE n=1 Tax=Paenibacillus thalictri TaxID=2527873 RepID=A0A4Q9DZD8_9BACL|nr:multi antimicrobial extrusion protein MatE [Paenibacillus thalictri]TBL81288.1 multi antimicrobial extrusion protein MatE [Paenibacillus thalictri]